MTDPRWTRWLPLAGIGAVMLWIAAFLMIESVRPEAETPTPEEILTYFQDESIVGMATFAYMLGAVLFLVFVVALCNRLQRAHGPLGGVTMLALAAGIVTAIAQLVIYGTDLEAHLDATAISPSTAEAYYYLGDYWFTGGMLMCALFVGAVGLVALRGVVLPRALGWISIVMAIPLLLPPVGWIVMLFLFPLWVLAVSLLLVTRAPAPAAIDERVPLSV